MKIVLPVFALRGYDRNSMHIIEHIERSKDPIFSFEIVPPPRGRTAKDIIDVVETLMPLDPAWIDVTSHSSTAYYHERGDGSLERKIFKKRPGTFGICGIIQNRFKIDTVAHVLCQGFSREETEDALIELNFLGIHNILALRGDAPNYQKKLRADQSVNTYAEDLVRQAAELRKGNYLQELDGSEPLDFCVGVAGYPEKHFEAPSLKIDLVNLKRKVEAGAQYIVTQMFFDNRYYFNYVEQCRAAGIHVPIIPGLKVIRSVQQMKSLPRSFYIDLPDELAEEIYASPERASEIGFRHALKQSQELLNSGVKNLHYYVLNDSKLVVDLVRNLKK